MKINNKVIYGLMVLLLISFAGILRFYHLGYSDYQGDEIKALYNPKEADSVDFFLTQRKGPAQFFVTAAVKGISSTYRNYFAVRFPFALAGFGSIVVFYLLAKKLFGNKTALYSLIFITTNGFFVAFSRIAQYQSLVIFFGLLASLITLKYLDSKKPVFLILAFTSWAFSLLSHYDGLFFAPIIVIPLVNEFINLKDKTSRLKLTKHIFCSGLIFAILSGVFYIPFAVNLAQSTVNYWVGRITGEISGKISSSSYLFSVYQPIYVIHIYTLFATVGTCLLVMSILFNRIKKIVNLTTHKTLSILTWFLVPFLIMEIFVYIPGTHIYTYLLPAFILIGVAISFFDDTVKRTGIYTLMAYRVGVGLLAVFLALQSFYIFVDNKYEYPWEEKKFLIWTLNKPNGSYHLSLFGFPYKRGWLEISDFIKNDNKSGYYSTNERTTIPRYYVSQVKDGDKMGYYIYVRANQKLINKPITNERVIEHAKTNPPVFIYKNRDRVMSEVYFLDRNAYQNIPSVDEEDMAEL